MQEQLVYDIPFSDEAGGPLKVLMCLPGGVQATFDLQIEYQRLVPAENLDLPIDGHGGILNFKFINGQT